MKTLCTVALTTATVITDEGTLTVVPAGALFTDSNTNTLVKLAQIIFTINNSTGFSPATFNGFQVAETGLSPATITGVTIDPATNLPGFGPGAVTFDAKDVFANFQNLRLTPSQNVTLNLTFAPAVPGASTTVSLGLLLALGFGGLVVGAKRKKSAPAL